MDPPDEDILPLAPFHATSPAMKVLRKRLLELGVFVSLHWNVILIVPPLIIKERELAEGIAALDEALAMADAPCEKSEIQSPISAQWRLI